MPSAPRVPIPLRRRDDSFSRLMRAYARVIRTVGRQIRRGRPAVVMPFSR